MIFFCDFRNILALFPSVSIHYIEYGKRTFAFIFLCKFIILSKMKELQILYLQAFVLIEMLFVHQS